MTISENAGLNAKSIRVGDLLQNDRLRIPYYQRPYKWQQRHVAQLFTDIQRFHKKSAYRLGSLVLHLNTDEDRFDIVDGQQRTITLCLIVRAFIQHRPNPENLKLRQLLNHAKSSLFNPELNHPVSYENVQKNYRFIEQRINNFSEESMLFLLEKCEFVQFTVKDLSIAFQFFDSQNARGKDLEPHDLLKAFHLRAFSKADEPLKEEVIEQWENTKTKELAGLFRYYLYRIKEWREGHSARYFTKANLDLFKGVNLEETKDLPFTQILRIAQVFTEMYNHSEVRNLDGGNMEYPFQLEMPVINGRKFFEMTSHYLSASKSLRKNVKQNVGNHSKAKEVIECLETYPHGNRTGDKYIRQLFNASLLQYVDKFGYREIGEAVVHLFIWAYKLRLTSQRVQLATMDNHAFKNGTYLHIIQIALRPEEVFMNPFPTGIDLRYKKKTVDLQRMFKTLLGEKIFDHD